MSKQCHRSVEAVTQEWNSSAIGHLMFDFLILFGNIRIDQWSLDRLEDWIHNETGLITIYNHYDRVRGIFKLLKLTLLFINGSVSQGIEYRIAISESELGNTVVDQIFSHSVFRIWWTNTKEAIKWRAEKWAKNIIHTLKLTALINWKW